MSAKEALKVLVGSITVYGAMAACSSASSPPVTPAMADVNAGGTRLKANYYAGSDGSQQFLSTFHDTMRNEDCAFQTASDGTVRCLPIQGSMPGAALSTYGVYYADAACTRPILALSTCTGNTAPKYVTTGGPFPGATTPKGPAFYEVGSPVSVATAYQLTYGGPGIAPPGTNACNTPIGPTPTCTAVPTTTPDAGVGDDAGSGTPSGFPVPPPPPTWASIESSSMLYSLALVPPSDFVEATLKTTM